MPEYRRASQRGGIYFFTLTTYQRQPFLTQAITRQALRDAINLTRARYPFIIHAWVLLHDHMHCIWELPMDDYDFSMRWSMIKRHSSKMIKRYLPTEHTIRNSSRKRRELDVWQRRFWEHVIRNEEDYNNHLDYIHWNPVKHGLVNSVGDWPYSSFHRLVKEGFYPAGWGDKVEIDTNGLFGE